MERISNCAFCHGHLSQCVQDCDNISDTDMICNRCDAVYYRSNGYIHFFFKWHETDNGHVYRIEYDLNDDTTSIIYKGHKDKLDRDEVMIEFKPIMPTKKILDRLLTVRTFQ